MKKIKVCLISNLYSPYISGGAELNAQKMAEALGQNGHQVFVITTTPFKGFSSLLARRQEQNGVRIYRFYPFNLFHVFSAADPKIPVWIKIIWRLIDVFNLHTFSAVLFILKKEKPDLVHTTNLGGISFSCFWVARLLGLPLVHTIRDYHLLCPYAGYLMCPVTKFQICRSQPFVCRVYALLKKIVVDNIPALVIGPSLFVIAMHKQAGFFTQTKSEVIPNFIELPFTKRLSRSPKQTLDFVYVGRVEPPKGIKVLITAFLAMKEDFIRLHIIGREAENREASKIADSDSRIKFYGQVSQKELRRLYLLMDVMVVPSLCYDNFPTVVLEAFSYAIPVIGTKTGGIPEQIQDNSNGFLINPGDVGELKTKIEIFIADFRSGGRLRNKMSENAFNSAQQYSIEERMQALQKVYQSLGFKADLPKST